MRSTSEAGPGGGRARSPLGRLLALGGLSTFGPLSLDLYLPALPRLTADLRTSEALAQLTMSLCMIGLAAGQLPAGPFSDRVGRRRPLLAGTALFAITSVSCALAPSVEVLLVVRLLNGMAGAIGLVVARAMVRDLYSGDAAARMFSLLMVVSGSAPVIAPLLGSQLLRVTDWRGVFVALGVIGLGLLLAASTLPETLPPERRHVGGFADTGRALRAVVHDRTLLAPALVLALGCCGMFVYIAMGSFVLQGGYGLSAQAYGVMFAVNATGIVLASRLSALLAGWIGPRRTLALAVAIAVAGAVALLAGVLLSRSVWAVLPPLFLVVASVGLIMPNATALALANQGRAAGTASAVLGLLQFALGALVPPLASLGGVTPVVMGTTILATAVAAALATVPVLRAGGRPSR
ncbi:multidrug effflux MFS transporter [Pseudonocardia acidicola]|uniref:multidrug effflux MFS transporter n=1 Tax=Pseudonocardia acidicola TaxID=2724939 RepID=UPI0030840C61